MRRVAGLVAQAARIPLRHSLFAVKPVRSIAQAHRFHNTSHHSSDYDPMDITNPSNPISPLNPSNTSEVGSGFKFFVGVAVFGGLVAYTEDYLRRSIP